MFCIFHETDHASHPTIIILYYFGLRHCYFTLVLRRPHAAFTKSSSTFALHFCCNNDIAIVLSVNDIEYFSCFREKKSASPLGFFLKLDKGTERTRSVLSVPVKLMSSLWNVSKFHPKLAISQELCRSNPLWHLVESLA